MVDSLKKNRHKSSFISVCKDRANKNLFILAFVRPQQKCFLFLIPISVDKYKI